MDDDHIKICKDSKNAKFITCSTDESVVKLSLQDESNQDNQQWKITLNEPKR